MKAIYKRAAMSAVVFSMFAITGTVEPAAASNGGPNDAYCIEGGTGSPWCGYATYSQCEATASGTGGDCVANAFGEQDRRALKHSPTIR
jgi:Protein of unknown function (DUF3551)